MAQSWIFLSGVLVLQWSVYMTTADPYATCLSCPDVASPRDCLHSMTCGKGEMCYTRAFTDNRGLRRYSLGCEDTSICNGSTNTNVLIGKRDVAPALSDGCLDCCSGFECNGRLCQAGGGNQVSSTATPGCPTCTCPGTSGCPKHYIQHGTSCYLFSTWMAYWGEAQEHCQKQGGDLVSINSKDEQDFLVQEMNALDIKNILSFQTGGVYSPSLHKWMWVDGSPAQYTNWMFPSLSAQVQTNETIEIYNPVDYYLYKTGPWGATNATLGPFICEKPMI